jgi:hypothetical protein
LVKTSEAMVSFAFVRIGLLKNQECFIELKQTKREKHLVYLLFYHRGPPY